MIIDSANAKSQVFSRIRRAQAQFSSAARAEIKRRYDATHSTSIPRPVVDGALIERFVEKHTAVKGTCKIVSKYSQIPDAVQEFLASYALPTKMVMGDTDFLRRLDWPKDWTIERRSACRTDHVAVTDAVCAIAETGTILIASSSTVSSTHLYLPENHVVVLDFGQLVRHLDDAIDLAMQRNGRPARGIHMITGPSKTADVEQTIQYGAHGPRRLHAVFVDSSAA